jgi:unsaturated rhamnogalacturonyl hydrolase
VAAYLGGYEDVLEVFDAYIDHGARRTPEGALNHNGVLELIDATAWVDSLFMFGMPLMRQFEFGGREQSLVFYGDQLRIFYEVLQQDNGLMRHADEHWINRQDEGVYWARGNGWVTAASAEYLRLMRNRGAVDAAVRDALNAQVSALLERQHDDGLWWTVLSHPGEAYRETSAAALMAFGMARAWRYGALGDEVLEPIRRAVRGLQTRLEQRDDGWVVVGTSGPTMAGRKNVYTDARLMDDLSYGVGAVVLALLERAGLPED